MAPITYYADDYYGPVYTAPHVGQTITREFEFNLSAALALDDHRFLRLGLGGGGDADSDLGGGRSSGGKQCRGDHGISCAGHGSLLFRARTWPSDGTR